MQSEAIASRYAKAVLDIAADSQKVEEFGQQLEAFREIFEASSELRVALTNPGIALEERHGLMNAILEKVGTKKTVGNFMRLLLDRGRMAYFPAICKAYQGQSDGLAGRARGVVYSAMSLSKPQMKKLQDSVGKLVGRTVVLEDRVDDALIGGIRVEIAGKVYDGSVKAQLDRLRSQLL